MYHSVKSKIEGLQHNVTLMDLKWESRSAYFSLYVILILLCSMYFAYKYRSQINNCRKRDRKIKVICNEEQAIPLHAIQVNPCLSQEIQA